MNRLLIVRGLPGSGKSTYAQLQKGIHIEADMYHINDEGRYDWKPENVHASHKWCQSLCKSKLEAGEDVVVSNTFTTLKELRPYLEMWDSVEIHECKGQFQNIHDVPNEVLRKMKGRWISNDDPRFIEYVRMIGINQ